jgi:hypothetical protein
MLRDASSSIPLSAFQNASKILNGGLSFPFAFASHTNHPPAAMEDPIASTNLATAGKPSQTIYVNNLNEKIKLPKLKQTLATTFRPLGTVLEVVALSNVPLAFATFLFQLLTTTPPPQGPSAGPGVCCYGNSGTSHRRC